MHGDRRTHYCGNAVRVLEHLSGYDPSKSDMAMMAAVDFIERVPIEAGIWVDAGWKNGRAKLAAILVLDVGVDVRVREMETASSYEAEVAAIRLAEESFPGDAPIHTDCQGAVPCSPRARWLSRELNAHADRLSNLRGNK